jgi:AcrR family transcriptional regulator
MSPTRSTAKVENGEEAAVRRRILSAAFAAFTENGYAGTSTLDIATRAHVSKRDLYALVGNKQELLAACIGERAKRLQMPADLPDPRDRESLAEALTALGHQFLQELSDPAVIAVFRLAVAEAVRAPDVARSLDGIGGEATRAALLGIIDRAQSAGLLREHSAEMADRFAGLLWGNLMLRLLLGVAMRPSQREITRRARDAAAAFLRLYPLPSEDRKISADDG